MRLTTEEIELIKLTARSQFGPATDVWLFGSRVDDTRRGGDIDLLICPSDTGVSNLFARKIRFLVDLEKRLGERKIDVVIDRPDNTLPIVDVAKTTGVRL